MRAHRLLLLLALLCFAVMPASAGNLNLRWSQCWGDGGTMNRSFACNTNAGNHQLVASFFMPVARANVTGNEVVIYLAVAGGSLPPWWQFKNVGSCRPTALSFSPLPPPEAVNCVDWAELQGAGGLASYTVDFLGPGTARILFAKAIPGSIPLTTGVEYFSFIAIISNAKTAGTGSCTGCSLGGCINLRQIKVTTTNVADDVIISPPSGSIGSDDRLALWQGGAGVVNQGPAALNCPLATPARNTSWGAVKALYR